MSDTPRKYFGGQTVHGGTIRKLDASNFQELVERYFNSPVSFRMTRQDFNALTTDEKDKIKDGPYVTACAFKDGQTLRNDANADYLNLLIIDLDEGEFVKDFFESPDALMEATYPYNMLAYTTAKHTPEAPRMKLVFDVERCPVEHHKPAVAMILKRLGLPSKFKGSRESNTLSLPAYRPIQFMGEKFSAVLCSRTNGIAISPTDIPDEITEEVESEMSYAYSGDTEGSGLAFLPVMDLTVEDIREPLMCIDADLPYEQWTWIAASIRHQFTDEDDAREAYELFDEWSSGGSKYKGSDETRGKWFSFKPYAAFRNPRTIKTLFHFALEAGWNPSKMVTSCKANFNTWLESCEDGDVLMKDGVQRIASLPYTNEILEEFLLNALRARIGQVVKGPLIALATFKKDLSNVRHIKRKEANDGNVPNWLRPWCYVTTANKFRNVATGSELVPDAFNNAMSSHLMPKDDDSEQAKTARPLILPIHFALNQIQIPKPDGVTYDPRHNGGDPYFTHEGKLYLNTYLNTSLPVEDAENSEAAGAMFVDHFEKIIGEPDLREHVINYLCYIVQNPGAKLPWTVFLQSVEGAGKGTLGEIMEAVLGMDNVSIVSSEVMKSSWNDWARDKVFIIMNEVRLPGESRETIMNNMKPLISDTRISINKRHSSASVSFNLTNYLLFSNFRDAILLKPGDRRYMVIYSSLQTQAEVRVLNEDGHFIRIRKLIHEWAGAMRHWMLNRKIPDSFPVNGPAPDSHYRRELIQSSKNKVLKLVEELILDPGVLLIHGDVICDRTLDCLTESVCRNSAPYNRYVQELGFQLYSNGDYFLVAGERTQVWTHRTFDTLFDDPVQILNDRAIQSQING